MSTTGVTGEFGRCLHRLEQAVAVACEAGPDWPRSVAAGVYAALEFAAAEPGAARILTDQAIARRHRGDPGFVAMVDRFAELLDRGAPLAARPPDARAIVTRIARQANLQLESGRRMMEIAPDLTFLALMPYLGFAEARRLSHPTAIA